MSKKIASLVVPVIFIVAVLAGCTPRVATQSDYKGKSFDPRDLISINDINIKEQLHNILSDNEDVRTDFRRIQDWVAANVVYDTYYMEYWQRPADTLHRKKGDCKDYSTLLCTLWRAYGVPAQDVYVAIGKGADNSNHAFIIEKYLNTRWHVVEPQVGGFIASDLGAADTAEKYAITFLFNDTYYMNSPMDIYGLIKGSGYTVTSIKTDINKRLPVINSFSSDSISIPVGQSAVLSWDVSNTKYIGIDQGIGSVDPIGEASVSPTNTSEYRLVAMNDAGSVMAALTVRVIPVAGNLVIEPETQSPVVKPKPLIIGFEGWLSKDEKVNMAMVGQQITARINLQGGNPGQYAARIWREVSTGRDDIVLQSAFSYDGISTTQDILFSPSYSIGESDTHGYWLDITENTEQIWKLPGTYPPRLVAYPKPIAGPLEVGFIGWYDKDIPISNTKAGTEINSGITLTGGSSGEYNLVAKKDTSGVADAIVKEIIFHYDGTSTIQRMEFVPLNSVGEDGTKGYYLELYKDGKYLWSLSGKYPPRLIVAR